MKLLRLKITDPSGFRSLPSGFEHHFRTEWTLQEELDKVEGFAPFVCAGPNGSGKSNLLEALAAIFFQLEILRVRRSFLPEVLQNSDLDFSPVGFELDYLIRIPTEYRRPDGPIWAKVGVRKVPGGSAIFLWENQSDFDIDGYEVTQGGHAILLPQYVLGYSSGENEILSLPFFKLRFVQFDEYWNALTRQLPYPGHPEARLAYLDNGFSQAILLCNLLFQDEPTLHPFRTDVGIEALKEFRIILRRSIPLQPEQLTVFANEGQNQSQSLDDIVESNPALRAETNDQGTTSYRLNLVQLLEGDQKSSLMVTALMRCATLSYLDEVSDTLILDYWVNDATKKAFRENFDSSPLALFQAFQVLLTLNLYSVGASLKADLYKSTSHYVSETVPTLASDQRVMRFKFVRFSKRDVAQPMMLKELSDGEHQLLHSLGLCLLFRNTNSLFLLDEPETHFNPNWRANFISRLRQCLPGNGDVGQEMLITTHTPFLISDSRPENVLVFSKDPSTGKASIERPDYNTLGASINKITMNTFGKRETIGAYAQAMLDDLRGRLETGGEETSALIDEVNRELGDSVEKILLMKAMLDKAEGAAAEGQG
ncbi:restriction system-associated AAA family ATPase [Bradyrhizobium sp. CCGE-LA001]|uniref:restriction system-associated AAA family ATPase n=1 Tax=Bradyrhizobium sp. CCGE-LA001 TaxID=1223566 RepID=UPI000745CC91|nr:restriction system-associated AAA family ATPase [Bradyrhizobium sp. CCGE-LA001]AMA60595.1 ABC transporter [Bradyrhizobium sp. CCGE-LA001]